MLDDHLPVNLVAATAAGVWPRTVRTWIARYQAEGVGGNRKRHTLVVGGGCAAFRVHLHVRLPRPPQSLPTTGARFRRPRLPIRPGRLGNVGAAPAA